MLSFAAGGSFLAYSLTSNQPAQAEAPAASQAPTATAAPIDPYKLPTTPHGLPKTITVYQYEVCPFCCKVKAFLDYHKLPYRVVEVNPLTKSELKWSQYKKVPVIVLDDNEQVNDSSAIISRLAAELAAQKETKKRGGSGVGVFSFGSKKKDAAGSSPEEEEKWRRWVDERLVRVITVNIYRTAKESFQTFEYISEAGNFGWVYREAARIAGATMMWSISNRLKKKYNVEGDPRENLYKCANDWVDAVGDDRPFLGGKTPNLADISVFGVMKSITGTDTFMDLQHKTRIGPWYERMFETVGETSRLSDQV